MAFLLVLHGFHGFSIMMLGLSQVLHSRSRGVWSIFLESDDSFTKISRKIGSF